MDLLQEQFLLEQAEAEMSPMQAFWIRVNTIAAELDPEAAGMDQRATQVNPRHNARFMKTSTKVIWCTSQKVAGKNSIPGRVFSMSPYLAAERMANGTHRIATEAEVEAWHEEQARRKATTAAIVAANRPPIAPTNVTVEFSAEALREMRSGKSRPPEQPAA